MTGYEMAGHRVREIARAEAYHRGPAMTYGIVEFDADILSAIDESVCEADEIIAATPAALMADAVDLVAEEPG